MEPAPVCLWTESVNGSTAWTTETTDKKRLGKMVKVDKNKTVPPEAGFTKGAGRWFTPKKIPAKPGNFIDININKYYQETNSLSGALTQYGGSGKPL